MRAFTDAAADAVARAIADVHREAQRERELRDAEHRARLAVLDGHISAAVETERRLSERLASLKDGANGVGISEIRRLDTGELVFDLSDGRSVDIGMVQGRDGKDGVDGHNGIDGTDGTDGKDADFASIDTRIADFEDRGRQTIADAIAQIRVPEDGKTVTVDDLLPVVEEVVTGAVARIDKPKDGVGVADVAINEEGDLIVSLTDGEKKNAGRSIGRDGADVDIEAVQQQIRTMFDAVPKQVDGKDGKLPIVRTWSDTVFYEGNVVTFDGRLYQAQRDTGKAPDHDDWLCIADRGRDGADGRDGQDAKPFTIRGTWLEINKYQALDVVALNGASFVAKRDEPGPCPGDGWQMMASQGKRGHAGERGQAGKETRGEPGLPVVAVEATDDGVLTLTNGDGTTVTCDLYPLLARATRQ